MSFIDRFWYQHGHPLSLAVWPLSLLYGAIVKRRRLAYLRGRHEARHPGVPVVVVGNLTAGGTGKTPLTAYLATMLQQRGWRPGIVSRGYGGAAKGAPCPVGPQSATEEVGDEPVLLARATGVPLWVASQRADAAAALLAEHPDVNVILCDDGLQHYALARDIELCVVDGARGFGNGRLIPAGPLREPVARLQACDALVVNGASTVTLPARPRFTMTLEPAACWNLAQPQTRLEATALAGREMVAVCGIGNPQRFLATLQGLGVRARLCAFADHHRYTLADLPGGELIVTEKDAVKLAQLPDIATVSGRIWVLPVQARLEPDLADWLIERLVAGTHGRKTA
ncbi:tetraacyldisaccharide 4'-kinase [Chitinibacteraceae bacterium HSL-7]